MPSPFSTSKTELLEAVLEFYDTTYKHWKVGWQLVRCFNPEGHSHGDRTPSLSVNLGAGKVKCHGCDLAGDGFDVMLRLEGWQAIEVLEQLGLSAEEESEWLI